MTTFYKCDFCNKTFRNSRECRIHESTHFSGAERIKYIILHDNEADICDYCSNSYYVYGCERDCSFNNCSPTNKYKDFVPTEPLRDKSIGGI